MRTASSHLLMRDQFCSFEVGLGSKKSKRCHKSIGLYWGQFCYLVARCCKFVIKTCKAHGVTVYTAEKSLAGSIVVSETFEPVKARSTFPSSWQRNFEARERWCQMMSNLFQCHVLHVLTSVYIFLLYWTHCTYCTCCTWSKCWLELHQSSIQQGLIQRTNRRNRCWGQPLEGLTVRLKTCCVSSQNAKAVQRCSKHIVTFPYIPYISH